MKIEAPNALRFIFQDDIYLLDEEKDLYNTPDLANHQGPEPQPAIETPQVNFNYLGSNKKNFLIVVNYPDHEFIADDHLAALESILGRKSHSRDDVAVLNVDKHSTAQYDQITAHFEPKTMVILGEGSIPAGMPQPKFNLPEKIGSLAVLYTFSFDEMMTNTDNKKAFWEQMKTL